MQGMSLIFLLPLAVVSLSAWIVIEDIRKLEVPAIPVLVLTIVSIMTGILLPLQDLSADHALWGAALGLAIATGTRLYIHWRVGVAAFGGADIALICGTGGLLGPYLLGIWLFVAALVGAIMIATSPLVTRNVDIEGTDLRVLPFCPALIVSAGITYALAYSGLIATWPK